MKRFLALFITTLTLSLSVAAQEHSRPPKSTTPPRAPNAPASVPDASASGWVRITNDEGRFSVLMPGTPEDKVETTPSEHGPYTTHLSILRQTDTVFLIGWVDYDPSFNFNRTAELEANRDNFVKGVNARLLETRSTRIDGFAAIEFTAENENRVFKSRVYMVGRRPYQLVIGSPKGSDDSVIINRFFNSFKVTVN
ncbi:MAG TPA: hypothetical protein VN644_20480 [Pyrinomonadaceae bacterium]|nr:hypothetical protein [Pyrinomonadaceae bacterium]